MDKALITVEDWSGGNTLNKKLGKKNNSFRSFGLDLVSRPGFLMSKQAWEAVTVSLSPSSTVADILYAITNGKTYFALSYYLFTLDTATSLASAHTDGTSEAIGNLLEYKSILYYSKQTKIGKYDFTTFADSWQTVTVGVPHPMIVSADSFMYVGNGNQIDRWDGSSYSANVFDLPAGWQIRCFSNFGVTYLAVPANFVGASGSTQCNIFLWDRISASWNDEINIPEQTIFATQFYKGGLWIWAGSTNVSLYYCPLGSRTAVKVFTFENTLPTLYFPTVSVNAVTVKNGRIWFGYSANTAASDQSIGGVYSFNPDPKNLQMQGEFLLSGFDEAGSDELLITCVRNVPGSSNAAVFLSQVYGSTFNIVRQTDSLTDPFQSSIGVTNLQTLFYEAPPGFKLYFEGFGIDTLKRPGGTITLEYKKDGETAWTKIYDYSATSGVGTWQKYQIECYQIAIRITITGLSGRVLFPLRRFYGTGKLTVDSR